MRCILFFLLSVLVCLTAGCAGHEGRPVGHPVYDASLGPVSYSGKGACRQGEEERIRLDLYPDGGFALVRSVRVGETATILHADAGTYGLAGDGRLLLVGASYRLASSSPLALEPGTQGGKSPESLFLQGFCSVGADAVFKFDRLGECDPVQPEMILMGRFRYMADAAIFTHAVTGRSYPVLMRGDFQSAERACISSKGCADPGVEMVFFGRLVARGPKGEMPALEGNAWQALMVTRFLGLVDSGLDTSRKRQATKAPLDGKWRILSMMGHPLGEKIGARSPFLRIEEDSEGSGRYHASLGCNRLAGIFHRETEGSLEFHAPVSTRMACPDVLARAERDFQLLVKRVSGYRLHGPVCELLDDSGVVLMVLMLQGEGASGQ